MPDTKRQLVDAMRATGTRCQELVETPKVPREVRDAVRRLCLLSSQGAGEIESLMDEVTCLEEALKPSESVGQKKATKGSKGDDSKR